MPRPRRSTTNYAAAADEAPAAKKSANPPKKAAVKAESKNTEKKGRRLSAEVLEERADKAAVHWEDCFKDLVKFHKKHGHSLVPKIYPENQKLAYWVQRNRKHYKLFNAKQKSLLDAKRIKRLEKLDFIFVARGAEIQSEIEKKKKREKGIAKWNRHFKELKEYKAKNGDCLVPKCFEENRALASWVYNQRFQFKKMNEGVDVPLDEERIKKLNAVGFCWKAKTNEAWRESDRVRRREKSQDGWDEKFEALVDFKKKHGHTCVPKTYKPDQPLSSWVFRMRRQYGFRMAGKINNMSDDRLERLKKIGFQFRVRPLKGQTKADLKFKAKATKSAKSRPSRSSRSKKESVKEESSDEEEEKVEAEAAEAEEEDKKSTSAGARTRFPRNAKAIASALTKPPPASMKSASKRKVKKETKEDDRKMPAKPDPVDDTEKAEDERPRRASRSRAAKSSNADSMESAVTTVSDRTKRKELRSLKRKSPASKPEQEPKKKSRVTSPSKADSKKAEPKKPQPMEIGSSPVVSTRTTRTSLAARASETKDSQENMEKTTKPADVPPPKTRTSPRRSKENQEENQKESTEVIQEKSILKARRSPRVSLQKPTPEPTKPSRKTSTSKEAKVPSKKSKDESSKKNTSNDKKEHVPNEVTSTETPKRTEPLRRSTRKRSVDAIEQIPSATEPPVEEPAKRTRPTRAAAAKYATLKTDIAPKKKTTKKASAKKPATKPSKTTAAKKTPEPKTKANPEPQAVAKPEPKKKELVYESEEESDDEFDTIQQYMVSPREEKRKEKKQKKYTEKQKIYIFSDSESEGFSDDDSSVEGTTKRYYSGDEYERSDDEGM